MKLAINEIAEKQLSNDEIEIYNYIFAVLLQNNSVRNEISVEDGNFKVTKIPTSKIVVSDITVSRIDTKIGYEESSNKYKEFFEKEMNATYFEAFDSFIQNNKSFNDISSLIDGDDRLVSFREVAEQMGETEGPADYWKKLYSIVPDACGKLDVSNIGIDSAKNIAIVEVKFYKDGMSGYINYLIFGKDENNKWTVIDVLQTVIS